MRQRKAKGKNKEAGGGKERQLEKKASERVVIGTKMGEKKEKKQR